jgi:hypothetical protein
MEPQRESVEKKYSMQELCEELSSAAYYGAETTVNELLARGVPANCVMSDGWTPLFSAAQQGHPRVVKILLENKANPAYETEWPARGRLNALTIAEGYKLLAEQRGDRYQADMHVKVMRVLKQALHPQAKGS